MPRVGLIPLALALAWCGGPVTAQSPAYRMLITNDDGVHASGLAAVAQVLQAIGQVIIVAPATDRDGANHLSRDPIYRDDLTLPNGLRAVGLSATPATTVAVALGRLLTPGPDLVVSGLDRGYALGTSTFVSGTVAAALEAAARGIPAIAVSLDDAAPANDLVFAAEEVLGVARRVKQYGLPAGTFLNVNIPPRSAGGYRGYQITTRSDGSGVPMRLVEAQHPSGQTIYWSLPGEGVAAPQGTDIRAVTEGYVSVTPVTLGGTDHAQIGQLRAIFE